MCDFDLRSIDRTNSIDEKLRDDAEFSGALLMPDKLILIDFSGYLH